MLNIFHVSISGVDPVTTLNTALEIKHVNLIRLTVGSTVTLTELKHGSWINSGWCNCLTVWRGWSTRQLGASHACVDGQSTKYTPRTPVYTVSEKRRKMQDWQIYTDQTAAEKRCRSGRKARLCQWLKWFCEAGGSPDEARLEQTPYPFQPH